MKRHRSQPVPFAARLDRCAAAARVAVRLTVHTTRTMRKAMQSPAPEPQLSEEESPMDAPDLTICTSDTVHVGQEVVLFEHSLLRRCASSLDVVVVAVDSEAQTYTVRYKTARGSQTFRVWDQWHGDGLSYCAPAAEVYQGTALDPAGR